MKSPSLPMQVCWEVWDANRGDYQNGWDTDQFPIDIYELTQTMLVFLKVEDLNQVESTLMLK